MTFELFSLIRCRSGFYIAIIIWEVAMLSQPEYDSLVNLSKNQPLPYSDISESKSLKDKEFIEPKLTGSLIAVYFITTIGKDAMLQFEQRREEQAKNERQQRFQNKIAVATVLVPLVTFVLGLVVEHFSGIVSFFLSLFQH